MRPKTKFPRALVAALWVLSACAHPQPRVQRGVQSVVPPRAPAPQTHVDTLHGVAIDDPFRWLEDSSDVRARAWLDRERAYAEEVLQQVVGVDSIVAGIEHLYASLTTLGTVRETTAGLLLERWFGERPSLLAIARGHNAERLLLSDSALAAARGGATMRAFVPSWDGRLVALGSTTDGDGTPGVSILDVERGTLLADQVPDLLTTTSGTRYEVTWLSDGSGFIYPREWPGAASGSPVERLARGRQFVHRLGTPQSQDVPIFGFDVSEDVTVDAEDLPTRVHTAPGTDWVVAALSRVRLSGSELYAARLRSDESGRIAVPEWQRIASVADRLGAVQLRGDTIYAISRRADRGMLVRRVLRESMPTSATWDTVVAERAGVITAFALQEDALYFAEREGGAVALFRLRWEERDISRIELPVSGGLELLRRPAGSPGASFALSTWASAPRYFRVEQNQDSATPMSIDDGGHSATSAVVSERIVVRSTDGVDVPISLAYDRSTLQDGKLDGSAPLLIEAYGGFGLSKDPEFSPHVATWISLGGVYAYAHVRGGGELGDAWHRAATRDGKQRTLDDMTAAIEGLIERRYTSAGRVVLSGFSFGANIPGLMLAQRPDLLGAIVFGAGTPDEIRGADFDPTARRNLGEVGDVDSPDGIRLLLKASPYHQVPSRVALPAMIVHSARADYNFGNEMLTAKYVARLRNANVGARPLLWLRTDGGHVPIWYGDAEFTARIYAFLLWQTGEKRFQPR